MIVAREMNTENLTDLAEAGFPGLLLSDLVELTDELMDRLPPHNSGMELWEVTCQAFNNATVLAGRTSAVERLNSLMKSLERFHELLTTAADHSHAQTRLSVLEFIRHTENRQLVISELIDQARSNAAYEIPAALESSRDEIQSPLRPR
ncbi:hypothetical protein SH449x_000200 [Pirellulaceae bacterium SH449]